METPPPLHQKAQGASGNAAATLALSADRVAEVVMSADGPRVAHVEVDLPELGLSRVSVTVQNGQATVELGCTSSKAARQAEGIAEGVRERLAAHGLELVEFSAREDRPTVATPAELGQSEARAARSPGSSWEGPRERPGGQGMELTGFSSRQGPEPQRDPAHGDARYQDERRARAASTYLVTGGSSARTLGRGVSAPTRHGRTLDVFM